MYGFYYREKWKAVRHNQRDAAWPDVSNDVQGRSVSKRAENRGDSEEGKDCDAD